MKVEEIPFVRLTGVQNKNKQLFIEERVEILNHIKTIHAGAQFTLAEAQSGQFLQDTFPDLEGQVVPVLRASQLKYKRPALGKIIASASCPDEVLEKFKTQFEKKGRASITVDTQIKDANDILCCEASFSFYVQGL